MQLTRREIIKAQAAATAAAVAGIALPAEAANVVMPGDEAQLRWDKAPCRFCGTGCGVMVAVKDGRVVATHGDIHAEVNRGLNCVKGYFLSKIMYGADRLTTPLLRMTDGEYAKDGEFTPISWDQAFDIMAEKFKAALKAKGPSGVGMFGSGQWTIWEGYAANKLFKGGFRSNNIDPNARHCMASAAFGFMRTFGMDEPMGCYDDIEAADAFVLWGSNMAEMHPILWTRVTDRRLSHPHVKVAVLSTFEHRSFDLADIPIVFTPQADLAMLNYIARHIIKTGRVNQDFVDKHTIFRRGNTDIGYGLRPEHPLEQQAKNAKDPTGSTEMTFDEFAAFVDAYDGPMVSKLSGVPESRLEALAELYADPAIKVMSFWTMGFNQHTRGVWANQMVYNLHLLTGKISEPGNSPFSLTGQPSACGTAREVGTFSHRLPADLVVTNPEHRQHAEEIWKLPPGTIGDKPGYHAVEQNRKLKDGELLAYWVQVNNNMQAAANMNEEGYPGYRNPDTFIVVSDAYPDRHHPRRRPDPAGRDVGREGGRLRQRRAAHPLLAPARRRARRGALGPVAAGRVQQAVHGRGGLARGAAGQGARARGQDALRRAVPQRPGRPLPAHRDRGRLREPGERRLRLLPAEGPVRGIRLVRPAPRPRPRPVRHLPPGARPALAGGRRQGDALALPRGARPLCRGRLGRPVLRLPRQEGADLRLPLRAAGRGAGRRSSTSGWSPAACSSTGIPAR